MHNIKKIIIVLLCIGIIYSPYKDRYSLSLDKEIEKYVEYKKILNIVHYNKGYLVFLQPPAYLGESDYICYIRKSILGYRRISGGGGTIDITEPITKSFGNIGETSIKGHPDSIPILSGKINNNDIKEIHIITRDNQNKIANIFETEIGLYWYMIYNPKDKVDTNPRLIGYDKFKSIIYDSCALTD